ncbi:hypothetical protein BU24DRAFT_424539 [Aaosphaeria arxii CBS 175.79]|uniref:Uncharacterized protein n=1 Tax=Aaosphaeria arxii CBS 175.79 TaxID=1450172 RepID=A0A6A5XL16_9PLEO|nr:uncharacterized protein BU24DRAFT_424539 [Aaosphaeria arxii CBS 175.79]KAF2013539.1 hypothetical protein BU24DRAFT_424539 [Aaosphaeria arxii CBS 175.79]
MFLVPHLRRRKTNIEHALKSVFKEAQHPLPSPMFCFPPHTQADCLNFLPSHHLSSSKFLPPSSPPFFAYVDHKLIFDPTPSSPGTRRIYSEFSAFVLPHIF